MIVDRYVGEPLDLVATYTGDPITQALPAESMATLTDVAMNLKRAPAIDSDDQYLQKTLIGGGVTINAGLFTFRMQIGSGDYGTLPPGVYVLVVACKAPSETKWLELELADARVEIKEAQNRV